MTVATIVDQERDHGSHALDVRPVDDGATVAGTAQQSRPHQYGQVGRPSVWAMSLAWLLLGIAVIGASSMPNATVG
jgi:hypothetical protein